jgi:hypothetical protein
VDRVEALLVGGDEKEVGAVGHGADVTAAAASRKDAQEQLQRAGGQRDGVVHPQRSDRSSPNGGQPDARAV